jgi:hypothetical protein
LWFDDRLLRVHRRHLRLPLHHFAKRRLDVFPTSARLFLYLHLFLHNPPPLSRISRPSLVLYISASPCRPSAFFASLPFPVSSRSILSQPNSANPPYIIFRRRSSRNDVAVRVPLSKQDWRGKQRQKEKEEGKERRRRFLRFPCRCLFFNSVPCRPRSVSFALPRRRRKLRILIKPLDFLLTSPSPHHFAGTLDDRA